LLQRLEVSEVFREESGQTTGKADSHVNTFFHTDDSRFTRLVLCNVRLMIMNTLSHIAHEDSVKTYEDVDMS